MRVVLVDFSISQLVSS